MIAGERSRWIFVLGVTAEAWARRWDLEPFAAPCAGCGELLTTDKPFAVGTLRGLAASPCRCGHHDRLHPGGVVSLPPYCVVRDPRAGDLLSGSDRMPPRKPLTRRRPRLP